MMKITSKIIAVTAGLALSAAASAGIEGKWQTFDDKDGQPKAVVQITESNGVYTGKIVCGNTPKAKQFVNEVVIRGLKAKSGNKYGDGKIYDPNSKKEYDLAVTDKGNQLHLRGYMGVKFVGRSQTWKKDTGLCK
ncbi:DUF2147 domain-containing protein [Moraxella nasovis]|uniref:DUF2147 domain-containing protein n=1 Tax=Moraxella nasovis TaxID=2904121 RepID=UPI001F6087F1|nr:DUF2147 domain-containing protein [Moraxella nasovis]UNU73977.1 DUF2147 domain-containing protein [Moraxella nasovis]